MFNYVSDISELSHYIIKNFLKTKNIAIDATLGNGHDTDFLSNEFSLVYSFDIQKIACDKYKAKAKSNTIIICDSHHKLNEYINSKVDCIMYNLGFLPGASKDITTLHETSLLSIKAGLNLLNDNGIMSICIYTGHDEGKKEKTCILKFLEDLPKNEFGVMIHKYLNRSKTAPMLVIIEKK